MGLKFKKRIKMKKILLILFLLSINHLQGMFLYSKTFYNNTKKAPLNKNQQLFLKNMFKKRYIILKKIKNDLSHVQWKELLSNLKLIQKQSELVWLQEPLVDMIVHDKKIKVDTFTKIKVICNELNVNYNAIHFVPLTNTRSGVKTTTESDFINNWSEPRVQLNFNRFNDFIEYNDPGAQWYSLSVAISHLICFNDLSLNRLFLASPSNDRKNSIIVLDEFLKHIKDESETLPFVVSKKLLDFSLKRADSIAQNSPLYINQYSKKHLLEIKQLVWD